MTAPERRSIDVGFMAKVDYAPAPDTTVAQPHTIFSFDLTLTEEQSREVFPQLSVDDVIVYAPRASVMAQCAPSDSRYIHVATVWAKDGAWYASTRHGYYMAAGATPAAAVEALRNAIAAYVDAHDVDDIWVMAVVGT